MDELRNKSGLTETEFLAGYDAGKFDRISVTVDMLLFSVMDQDEDNYRKLPEKQLKVLLVRRGDHPCIGQWALPGGFVNADESLDAAAARELKEETGIDHIYMEQLYTYGSPRRDPRTRIVSTAYMALLDRAIELQAGDDAADARWFGVERQVLQEVRTNTGRGSVVEQLVELRLSNQTVHLSGVMKITKTIDGKVTRFNREIVDSCGIAFDHTDIISYGLERLRNKIEYTDIAFSLMPEYFTLTELQQVYEVILDRELLKANFRRKIAPMVAETNMRKTDAGHRPSKLYKYNPNWVEDVF
ncbi:NUDIX hydrolase [Acetonema longum]|uniref:NUDIX hydrolase n=1 Tax=Acetonema longum DSM 6540 TaxID=1009370 RepID=F7NFK9_9FIRM|nr:NUDIX domain-containing protein [Acetonema longum]EGO65172.1 NUDIX hydrolase [Acetonema longum DSM 6540]